jgi:hypothetical protein
MKTLPASTSLFERVEPVRVFLDDLEEIVGMLSSMSLDVAIIVGQIQFDSLSELREQQGASVGQLMLRGRHRETDWIEIKLDFSHRALQFSSGDTRQLGPQTFAILERARALRYFPFWLKLWPWFASAWTLSAVSWFLPKRYLPVVTSLSLLLIAGVSTALWLRTGATWIRLRRRHEGGFWKRNSDKILLLFIGTLIGTLIGTTVTALVQWLRAK